MAILRFDRQLLDLEHGFTAQAQDVEGHAFVSVHTSHGTCEIPFKSQESADAFLSDLQTHSGSRKMRALIVVPDANHGYVLGSRQASGKIKPVAEKAAVRRKKKGVEAVPAAAESAE